MNKLKNNKTNRIFQTGGLLDWFSSPPKFIDADTKKEASDKFINTQKEFTEFKNPQEEDIRKHLGSLGYTVLQNSPESESYAVIVDGLGNTVGKLEETTTLEEIQNKFKTKDPNYMDLEYKKGGKLKYIRRRK